MLIATPGNTQTAAQRRLALLQRGSAPTQSPHRPTPTGQPTLGAPPRRQAPAPVFGNRPTATDTIHDGRTSKPKPPKLPVPKARLEFPEEAGLWATIANPTARANSTAKKRLIEFIGEIGFDNLLTMISNGAMAHHHFFARSMDGIVMTGSGTEIKVAVSLKKGGAVWHDAMGKATNTIPVAKITIHGGTAYLTWAGEEHPTVLSPEGPRIKSTLALM